MKYPHLLITHWLARLWLAALAALGVAALLGMTFGKWPGIPVHTNIMELLPSLRSDPVLLDALARSNRDLSRKLLVLVGNPDPTITRTASDAIRHNIAQQPFLTLPLDTLDAKHITEAGRFYYRWRNVLLSNKQRQWLTHHDNAAFEQQLTQTLYSPIAGVNAALLSHDPLLTFYHFMRDLPGLPGKLQLIDGALQAAGTDRTYRVLVVDVQRDVFDMSFHPAYQQWRNALQTDVSSRFPGTEVLLVGAVEHAVWGASSARHEVTTIGNGSLLGIIALTLLVFNGSIRTLLVSLLPLGTGVAAGLAATVWYFGYVHLITLVFGSSVIGVAMDYALHYFTEHYKLSSQQPTHDVQHSLRQVLPGITLAMITSAIAYAAIGFAPFPVLRQIALFSCVGLVVAWLTVVSLFPSLLPPTAFRNQRYLQWSDAFDTRLRHLFDSRHSRWILCALALAMLPGIMTLQPNDDLRLLQTPPPSIVATEQRVQSLTGMESSGRFFLVEGDSIETVLQRSEALTDAIHRALPHATVDALTRYLPSQARQAANAVLQRGLYQPNGIAQHWQTQIGLPNSVITDAAAPLAHSPTEWLTYDALTTSPFAHAIERYQLTATSRGWIAALFVQGTADVATLRQLATPTAGVYWMDPVADISDLFRHYREQTGVMMAVAYAVIALLLCWRYRPAQAMRVLLAPAFAAWVTLGVLGYAGVQINLFHVLALLLTLGVGIDYSIFFAESDTHRDATMLAVVLSTITTLLSFGLLSLSDTAAIRSFGIVVSIGLVCALLFSPLAQHKSTA